MSEQAYVWINEQPPFVEGLCIVRVGRGIRFVYLCKEEDLIYILEDGRQAVLLSSWWKASYEYRGPNPALVAPLTDEPE